MFLTFICSIHFLCFPDQPYLTSYLQQLPGKLYLLILSFPFPTDLYDQDEVGDGLLQFLGKQVAVVVHDDGIGVVNRDSAKVSWN